MVSGASRVFNGCRSLLVAATSATPKSIATVATTTTIAKKKSTVKKLTEKPTKKTKQATTERSMKPVCILKPSPISPAIGNFLSISKSHRTYAVKKIWEYIKLH